MAGPANRAKLFLCKADAGVLSELSKTLKVMQRKALEGVIDVMIGVVCVRGRRSPIGANIRCCRSRAPGRPRVLRCWRFSAVAQARQRGSDQARIAMLVLVAFKPVEAGGASFVQKGVERFAKRG